MISRKESGVAIWYILMAIILFAALSYSFMRSVNQTKSGQSREKSLIVANEILREMKSIEQAIQKLQLVNGCSENEISFYSSKWSTPGDYDNVNALFANGDFNCFVYHQNGGGLNFSAYRQSLLSGLSEGIYFTSDFSVQDIGSAASDLIMFINVNEQSCIQVNNEADIGNANDAGGVISTYASPFTGSYALIDTIGDEVAHADLAGKEFGCLIDNNGDYVFYGVLIER